MTKIDHRMIFILLSIFLYMASYYSPDALGDSNEFLKEFVGSPFLSVLGFITAVTMAAVISVHLHLNDLADKTNINFDRVKKALSKSLTSLIVIYVVALVIVIFKQALPEDETWKAFSNSSAVILILFDLSVMLDISRTVLKIPPAKDV